MVYLFFFAAGITLYSVPTQALKDNVDLDPFVSVHGEKVHSDRQTY